jgi:hypothetical protein
MIVIASTVSNVLVAVGAAVAASVAVTAALGLITLRDERRNRVLLQDSKASASELEHAAAEAEKESRAVIHDVLESAVAEVAADQQLSSGLVRGALFAREPDGSLRIVEGQTVGFESREEARIRIQPGESGTGEAAKAGLPAVTVFRSVLDETTIEDPEERARIDPSLRWIISVPVLGGDHQAVWVLSVDGLVEPRTQEQLQSSVAHLLYYGRILELLLRAGSAIRSRRSRRRSS